ncbi:Protein SNOWY COTYLEDON 3 [Zea mays]|uniref:Protein SNOWY COTYLEDON 3 n=1 Tax=Zea mays TaxID=4577 RepID=A0A1D6PHX5_MAIZE|nr:Protein SNOWY COTYLEDON 3 [Zea mays]
MLGTASWPHHSHTGASQAQGRRISCPTQAKITDNRSKSQKRAKQLQKQREEWGVVGIKKKTQAKSPLHYSPSNCKHCFTSSLLLLVLAGASIRRAPAAAGGSGGPSRSGTGAGESGARRTCIAARPPRVGRSPPVPCRSTGMVAAAAAATAPDPARPSRPPLTPALDKPNSAAARRNSRSNKPVSSRYLPAAASPASSTSSSSSSSSSSRRSLSAQRARSSTPPPQHSTSPTTTASAAATATATTMRSLSVSFQGESFFYKTSRAPRASSPSSPAARRGPTPERRKSVSSVPEAENARPPGRWPAAKPKASDPLARSLDCSLDRKDSILAAVHLLRRSMAFDSTTSLSPSDPAAAAAPDLYASSDTDSVSSGSNSGASDPPRRGISVPARFWQETNSRLRRLPEPGLPLPSSGRRSFSDSPMSPRLPGRSPSPCRGSRGGASPSRGRSGEASPNGHMVQAPANAPSIISFAAEVRRAKKGENRIEEAHRLRLLDNRYLQWRCINARTDATLLVQSFTAEEHVKKFPSWGPQDFGLACYVYGYCIGRLGWICARKLSTVHGKKYQDCVTMSVPKGADSSFKSKNSSCLLFLGGRQMSFLEDWSHIEKHHSSALSAAIKALKASTLRLPVVDGAKADALAVKEAVNSAVDVMNTMTSSICNLLSKVEGTSSVVSELSKLATQEQMLLDQSKDLLSTVAAIHVKNCSLQTHMLQRNQKQSPAQL